MLYRAAAACCIAWTRQRLGERVVSFSERFSCAGDFCVAARVKSISFFIIEYWSILGPVLRAQCYVAQRRPAASRGRGIVSDIALSRSPRVCSETASRAGSFPSQKPCLILRGHAVGSARAGEVIECAKMEQASVCKRWGEPSWGNAVARYKRRNSAGKFLLTGTSHCPRPV